MSPRILGYKVVVLVDLVDLVDLVGMVSVVIGQFPRMMRTTHSVDASLNERSLAENGLDGKA
jgi:hypothetical protein